MNSTVPSGMQRAPAYIPIANEVTKRLAEKMKGIPLSLLPEAALMRPPRPTYWGVLYGRIAEKGRGGDKWRNIRPSQSFCCRRIGGAGKFRCEP